MRIRRFLNLLLILVVVVLTVQLVGTLRRPLLTIPKGGVQKKTTPPSVMAVNEIAPEEAKQLAEAIASKNLFAPNRGQETPVATATEPPPPPPPSHLKLVGVVLSRSRQEAFFSDASQGGKVIRVRSGDSIGAYRLVRIAALNATLAVGASGGEVSLPLLVLDSGSAARVPHLIPPHPGERPEGQEGQVGYATPPPAMGEEASPDAPLQEEAQAIRENIQQLQQRLRQIRRQAARQEVSEDEGGEEE